MRLYWEVARRGFRKYAAYRAATVAGLFTNTVFGFFRVYVLIALFNVKGTVGNYDVSDAVTYVWLTQSLLMTVALWGWWDIAQTIRTGDVATDLFRPYDYQLYWLSQDLGRAAYQLLARGIVPFFIGSIAFHLRVPMEPGIWAATIFSVFLAVVLAFGIRFLMNLLTFWIISERGIAGLFGSAWLVFGGFILPLGFFPQWLETAARVLPFSATFQVPIDIFLGKHSGGGGADLVSALAFQAVWAAVILMFGRLILAVATRRVVTQGG